MPNPTIGAAIHLTRTVAQGPQHALGTEVMIGGSTLDQTLFWVDSDGVVAGGPQYGPFAAATDVEVVHPANSGEQVWMYVFNDSGATIQRGAAVMRKLGSVDGTVAVAATGTASQGVIGVAQYDIVDDDYAWILKKGLGEVIADTGGITADTGLVVGDAVAGAADDVAATTDHAFAISTETVTATNLATCFINCPGA